MTNDKRKDKKVVSVPKSIFEAYADKAKEEGKFISEVIRDTLRDNAPKKPKKEPKEKKEKESNEGDVDGWWKKANK